MTQCLSGDLFFSGQNILNHTKHQKNTGYNVHNVLQAKAETDGHM